MDAVFLAARILFVVVFLASALGHLTQSAGMAQYAKFKGAPGGRFGVLATGVTFGLGALSVLLGIYGELGALLLAATLVPVTVFMHAFWKETDAQAKQTEMVAFNKNLGLMGGALGLFLLFAAEKLDLGLTITGPLFTL